MNMYATGGYHSDGTVQEAINPDKSPEEVEQESSVGHEMYATTHGDYNVGKKKCYYAN